MCCVDECTEYGSCNGYLFTECKKTVDECNKEVMRGIIKGKCGVECKINTDCSMGTKCNTLNYRCEKYSMNTKIQAGDFAWTITGVTKTKSFGGSYFISRADGEYLVISVEIENTGKTAQYLSSDYLKLIDDKNREFSSTYVLGEDSIISFETINPGIVKKGKIIFDVPEGIKVINVKISSNLIESSFYNVQLLI